MNDLASAIRNIDLGIEPAPQPEPGPSEWIDGNTVYRLTEDGYTATLVEHDGYPWDGRVTGHGATLAQAQLNMFEKVAEWNS